MQSPCISRRRVSGQALTSAQRHSKRCFASRAGRTSGFLLPRCPLVSLDRFLLSLSQTCGVTIRNPNQVRPLVPSSSWTEFSDQRISIFALIFMPFYTKVLLLLLGEIWCCHRKGIPCHSLILKELMAGVDVNPEQDTVLWVDLSPNR